MRVNKRRKLTTKLCSQQQATYTASIPDFNVYLQDAIAASVYAADYKQPLAT